MSSSNQAAEELKALAWYCSEENATGTTSDPYAYLGIGKGVVGTYASEQADPPLTMHGIYATGSLHDSGDYADLNLRFVTPYRDSEHIKPSFVRVAARIGLHVTNEEVLVSVDRNEGKFARTPLELFIAPLGKWALETFPDAEEPSTEFVNYFRTTNETDRGTIEALKAEMRHPLDDSVDIAGLVDFFTSKDSRASLFERVYVGGVEPYIQVKPIE